MDDKARTDIAKLKEFADHIDETLGLTELPDFWQLLGRHAPRTLDAYFAMREPLFSRSENHPGLDKRSVELHIVALDIVTGNTWGVRVHTRAAIEAGASPHDIADVVSLVILSTGIINHRLAGYVALEEVERAFGPPPYEADGSAAPAAE
jgi:AhpD family alkylhydroperoxidase